VADRYLRTGTTVPEIYPGDLKSLARAAAATREWSRHCGGQHKLHVVREGERLVTQVYESGELTWVLDRD
jgi:hypothetical protein